MKEALEKLRFLILALLILISVNIFSQDSKSREIQKVFSRIEEGIETGSIDKFASYFSSRNYLSLRGGISGYYSENQTFYVIKDFFSINQPLAFKLTNIVSDQSTPFAAGMLRYINRGIRSTATVFISLQWVDHQWRISQITIN
jgi:hypothetical protein